MIAFLLVMYTAVVLLLFKLKLVKPRPYPIAWIIVAGVFLIGGVFVAWMLFAPVSGKLVSTQYVVQLVPYVKGQVKKVHAQPNKPLKKGDLLLEIEPAPYQYTVNQAQSQLEVAKTNVDQSKAGLKAADANVSKSTAAVSQAEAALDQAKATVVASQGALSKAVAMDDLAKTAEMIALSVQKTEAAAISVLKVAEATQKRAAADATVKETEGTVAQAQAAEQQAVASLAGSRFAQQQAEAADQQSAFALKMAEANVPAVQAQLDEALFNLGQCRMYAPSDGYVVDWQVQEGTMLVSLPLAPAGTFINTSDTYFAAVFPQNYLTNVEAGNEVEMVLDPFPGRLFKGKVENVILASGGGQFTTGGKIPRAGEIGSEGLFAVKIRLSDEPSIMPLGAGGSVAIYTDYGKPVHIVSKVVIRMKRWLSYVIPSVQKP